ncbi:phosphoserine phosphatase SerB [Pseudoalteromonas sp. MMG013]|uniref:phosphoserine phosphatase SerB n=1 Tax=Pseudoalteromonas sp. MMG013 TaxID=2822687 RepID=UPI001B371A4B|nr:phosphoserine phosphatase SerB [Pseudoalteromonas sp. MMG013]MBQ4861081.1 phosphoserine phosphatase SerB [Pseudoalteromonas sp. MMG013]
MSTVSLTHLSEKPLSQVLTLAKWYQVENAQLIESQKIPSRHNGLFITLFGDELSAISLVTVLTFAHQHNVKVQSVCLYQPDEELESALALYSDVEMTEATLHDFRAGLRRIGADQQLQAACIMNPANNQQPGLLVMDMDSTAIKVECIDEIARLAGVYEEVAHITAQAMAGKLAFNDSLNQRVAKLEGVELSLIQALKDDLPLMEGIQALCHHLKSNGWHLVIASGGFSWFAQALQKPLQLDEYYANELEIANNKLTGKVLGQVVDAQSKAAILSHLRLQLGLPKAQTVAIGDGANDLLMMAEAGTGIAVHGKPKVVSQADAAICQGSLLQVLYILSIPAK